MFIGLVEYKFNIYIDKSIRSGIRYEMRRKYRCEHCEADHHVCATVPAPSEPFYCDCGRLVALEPQQ